MSKYGNGAKWSYNLNVTFGGKTHLMPVFTRIFCRLTPFSWLTLCHMWGHTRN